MKRINFYLSDKQIETLKALSEEVGLSVSELVRRAVDEYTIRQREATVKK